MIDFLTPYKPAILGTLSILVIIGLFSYRSRIINDAENRVNATWQAKENAATIQAQATLLQKNSEISAKQKQLHKSQQDIIDKNKELDHVRNMYTDLRNKYASGSLRMSVPTTNKSSGPKQAGDPTTSTGAQYEDRELLPDVSVEILNFARDYQSNLRLKNECVDLYNSVRDTFNSEE